MFVLYNKTMIILFKSYKIRKVFIFIFLFIFLSFYLINENLNELKTNEQFIENNFKTHLIYSNKTWFPFRIVPNIVHYILFDECVIDFGHFVSILSVLKNQNPDSIYIHCHCHQLSGHYYQRAVTLANSLKKKTKIKVKFGHKLNKTLAHHRSSDIIKIQVLKKFGGIYLDRDVYVVQPLHKFLRHNMTVQWDDTEILSYHLMISSKNSLFLTLWLNSILDHRPDLSHYSWKGLQKKKILPKRPKLLFRVKKFGADPSVVCPLVYTQYYNKWNKDFFAIRLNIRGNQVMDECFKATRPLVTSFNEKVILDLKTTFGEMTRNAFDFEKNVIMFSN